MIIRPFLRCTFFVLLLLSTAVIHAAPLVAVDVGHGVRDAGAFSARGRSEFEFNRDFAVILAGALRQRKFVVREVNFSGNVTVLADRPLAARGSNFFISIHHDSISERYLQFWDWDGSEASYTNDKRGFGLFVSKDNPHLALSLRCASQIGNSLRQQEVLPTPCQGRKNQTADAENGVWFYDNLVVLYRTTLPAVLFEVGVIKHREEELELLDPQRQERMAEAVAGGIAECLDVKEKSALE
mgnify:FL=1